MVIVSYFVHIIVVWSEFDISKMYAPGGLLFSITAWCSLGQQVVAFSNLQNLPHAYLHDKHAPEKRLLINGLDKPIDVSGEHAFQPPTESDQRGPCPGMKIHDGLLYYCLADLLRTECPCQPQLHFS